MKLRYMLPFGIFVCIACILWRGLGLHPNQIPSPLINKPAPAFTLPSLFNAKVSINNQAFIGHVTLLNVWASWCYACAQEHDFLLQLAKDPDFTLIGLNYKDSQADAQKVLHDHGNPYQSVGFDAVGDVAIDWGVYGAPETFIIDKKGIVRYKQIGPITPTVWEQELKPLIHQLRAEA